MLRGGLGRPRRLSSCCLSGLRARWSRPWRPVRFERDGQVGRAGGGEGDRERRPCAGRGGTQNLNLAHVSRRA